MPIYEYTCELCKARFEQLVRTMKGGEKAKCPKCGSPEAARSLSLFAVSSAGPKSSGAEAPMCGRCGGQPGSCATG